MARRSAAFKRPPAPVPSASPAGVSAGMARPRRPAPVDLASPVDVDVAVDDRPPPRPGRAVECVRPLRAGGPGRVRRWLAEPRRPAAVQDHRHGRRHPQDHHPQQLAGHLVRPLDQPVSRLRARLHLLLRPADPRLSGSVARARFRVQAVREAGGRQAARARTVGAGLRAAHHRDRHQHRSVPADRARVSGDAAHSRSAGAVRPPGRHRHQVGAGDARHRHPVADGGAPARQGRAVGDDARSQAGARDGAARRDAGAAARCAAAVERGRAFRPPSWSRR